MRNPLSIFILILWFLLGLAYCNSSKKCCDIVTTDKTTAVVADTIQTKKVVLGPLVFNWGDSTAITGDGWANYKQEILSKLHDNQILEITGYYSADEVNNTSFENLGLARANAIRQLFPELPDERFRLSSKLVDANQLDKSNPFAAAEFNYRVNTDNIKEIDQRTLIYFPFSSTNKLNDGEVEAYLDDVVEALKGNNKKVRLTGHTDSVSSTESNIRLGQRRADVIKQYLVSKGLSADRIISNSQGEANPVDTNDTAEGRANNRRTELEIIN